MSAIDERLRALDLVLPDVPRGGSRCATARFISFTAGNWSPRERSDAAAIRRPPASMFELCKTNDDRSIP